MRSRSHGPDADTVKAGGIYAGLAAFVLVWIVGSASGVPFRVTVWRGVAGAVGLYLITCFLLRIFFHPAGRGPARPPREESPLGDGRDGP